MADRPLVLTLDADDLDTLDGLCEATTTSLDELTSAVMVGYARADGRDRRHASTVRCSMQAIAVARPAAGWP